MQKNCNTFHTNEIIIFCYNKNLPDKNECQSWRQLQLLVQKLISHAYS